MDFGEREGVINDYYKELFSTGNPVGFFSSMLRDLLSVNISSKEFPMLAKLIKLYGRKPLFHSIVEIAESTDLEVNKFPYGLLIYLCKRNIGLTEEANYANHPLLTDFISRVDKEIAKTAKKKKEIVNE